MHSDHFPIFIGALEQASQTSLTQRWLLKEADWSSFAAQVDLGLEGSGELETVDAFVEVIQVVADKLFEKSKGVLRRAPVPWWGEDVAKAVRDRRKAYHRYRRRPTEKLLGEFRRSRARARFVIRQARRKQLLDHLSKVNCHTPVSDVWSFVRRMRERSRRSGPIVLRQEDGELTDNPVLVAEVLAGEFERGSSSSSYEPSFRRFFFFFFF